MGLAASQARLLTITSRKSDCEFQSMRYSHEKIALSRSMTDLSTQYQNSLDATKLVYDFYGTGDTSYGLTYGLMMTPSELNGYLPILTTDTSGKTVLNSAYAAAARAAGIPQEGIGSLPSQEVRNNFLDGLAANGVLTTDQAETYKGIQYASSMGLGTTDLVTTQVESMTYKELLDYMSNSTNLCYSTKVTSLTGTSLDNIENGNAINSVIIRSDNAADITQGSNSSFGLSDILNNNYRILVSANQDNDGDRTLDEVTPCIKNAVTAISSSEIWDWMFEEFESILGVTGDSKIQTALNYAKSMTQSLINPSNLALEYQSYMCQTSTIGESCYGYTTGVEGAMDGIKQQNPEGGAGSDPATVFDNADFLGFITLTNKYNNGSGHPEREKDARDGVAINITNIAKAYLTYFAQYMEGLQNSQFYINGDQKVANSNLINEESDFTFMVQTATGINTDQALQSGFYDAIFNQICLNGWTENNNVNDSDYLQEMIKTGKYMISTCSDDGYYYQGSYSTNTYIREISDDEAIAKAEAKYNTEKQRLNQKEEIIDLKMKNLDTEISSLTTEYDTVKSLISKNIEKGFKRYDA